MTRVRPPIATGEPELEELLDELLEELLDELLELELELLDEELELELLDEELELLEALPPHAAKEATPKKNKI